MTGLEFWVVVEPLLVGPFVLFATIGVISRRRREARLERTRVRRLDLRQARVEGHA